MALLSCGDRDQSSGKLLQTEFAGQGTEKEGTLKRKLRIEVPLNLYLNTYSAYMGRTSKRKKDVRILFFISLFIHFEKKQDLAVYAHEWE